MIKQFRYKNLKKLLRRIPSLKCLQLISNQFLYPSLQRLSQFNSLLNKKSRLKSKLYREKEGVANS